MTNKPTEEQLFEFYLKAGIDDIMPFESRYGSASGRDWAEANWNRKDQYLKDLNG